MGLAILSHARPDPLVIVPEDFRQRLPCTDRGVIDTPWRSFQGQEAADSDFARLRDGFLSCAAPRPHSNMLKGRLGSKMNEVKIPDKKS